MSIPSGGSVWFMWLSKSSYSRSLLWRPWIRRLLITYITYILAPSTPVGQARSKCPRCCPLPGASTAAPPRRPDHLDGVNLNRHRDDEHTRRARRIDWKEHTKKNIYQRRGINFSLRLVLWCRNSFTRQQSGFRVNHTFSRWHSFTYEQCQRENVLLISSQLHLLPLALVYLLKIAWPVVVSSVVLNHSWSDNFEQVLRD